MSAFRAFAAAFALTGVAACQQMPGLGEAAWARPVIAPTPQAQTTACPVNPALSAQNDDAVNAVRQAQGKTVLDPAPLLAQIAQSHACDIGRQGRLDVEGSDGTNVVDRARAVGYPACGLVQLVGRGGSPGDAVASWLGQEAQRAELLGQASRQVGSGFAIGAEGLPYYSVVLGDNCQ